MKFTYTYSPCGQCQHNEVCKFVGEPSSISSKVVAWMSEQKLTNPMLRINFECRSFSAIKAVPRNLPDTFEE